MRKIIITLALYISAITSYGQQDNSMLLAAGDTPQLNMLNPGFMPKSSYFSVPFFGGISLRATNSFSYNRVLGDDKQLDLSKIRKNSRFLTSVNMDFINFGIRFKESHMVNFAVRSRAYGGITYPTGAFQFIQDNPINSTNMFNVDMRDMALAWNEIAVGYTHKLNENWSFGGKVKYLMGMASINTGQSKVTLDKSLTDYTIQGKVDFLLGNYDAANEEFSTDGLTKNGGFSVDLGAVYQSNDKRWSVGVSILDLGFIHWNQDYSSRIYSKNPDAKYQFNGFGDLEEVFNNGDFGDMMNNTYDDIINSMDVDTVRAGFSKMLPTTFNVGGTYFIDDYGQHMLSGSFIGSAYVGHPMDYSINAGYTYSLPNNKFKAMGSLIHRRNDPISIGAGIVAASKGFQFFLMGDISMAAIAEAKNMRGVGLRMGLNIFMGKYKHN